MSEPLNRYEKLKRAADQLNSFSKKEKKPTSIAKTIASVYEFFRTGNAPSLEAPHDLHIEAAKTIRDQRQLLTQLLKEGSPEERRLAESVNQAVAFYNKRCQQLEHPSEHIIPIIDLPPPCTIKYYFPPLQPEVKQELQDGDQSMNIKTGNIKAVNIHPESNILENKLLSLFQMKVIALLRKYQLVSTSESYPLVTDAPINLSETNDDSICKLTQILSPLPGVIISIKADSSIDPNTKKISQLFPDTFSVRYESTQTGFPHPKQHSGWALGFQLLPEFPKNLDLLNDVINLFPRRKLMIQALLHDPDVINRAKKILLLKKEAFTLNQTEFLNLHKKLAQIMMAQVKEPNHKIIDEFYCYLSNSQNSYDLLTDTYQYVRDNYIAKPHEALRELILTEDRTTFSHLTVEERCQLAKKCLQSAFNTANKEVLDAIDIAKSTHEQIKLKYAQYLGHYMGKSTIPIVLQYFSEDLGYEAPILKTFEQQLQVAALKQNSEFIDSLTSTHHDLNSTYDSMKHSLITDLSIFKDEISFSVYHVLATRLTQYYRYKPLQDNS